MSEPAPRPRARRSGRGLALPWAGSAGGVLGLLRASLGAKLVAVLVVAAVLPSVAAVGLVVKRTGDFSRDRDAQTGNRVLSQTADQIGDDFQLWAGELLSAAQNDAIKGIYRDPGRYLALKPSIDASLVGLHRINQTLIDEACLIDARGPERARMVRGEAVPVSELSASESDNVFFSPAFGTAEGSVYQGNPYVSSDSRSWVVPSATPIVVDGRKVAVLHFESELESLRTTLLGVVPDGVQARITDATGQTILDTARPTPNPGGSGAAGSTDHGDHHEHAVLPALGDLTGDSGHAVYATVIHPDPRQAMTWRIQVRVPTTPVLSGSLVAELLALIAATFAFIGLVVRHLVRGTVRPLRKLTEQAERLARGELEGSLEVRSRDEIGRLSAAVNTATDALHAMVVELQGAIRQRDAASEMLRMQALVDPVTRLGNRNMLVEEIAQLPAGSPCALAFLDLDDFKVVNDTQGHGTGDELLRLVAARLGAAIAEDDTAIRLGGDEFAVLMRHTGVAAAQERMETVLRHLLLPFDLAGSVIRIGASIGIADLGVSPDPIACADLAMYASKRQGKGRVTVFDPSYHSITDDPLLAQDLRTALETGGLRLEYQPLVDLASEEVVSCEALTRWTHPTRGPVSPDRLFGVAAAHGLSARVDRWVLSAAVAQLGAWLRAGDAVPVAVNLTAAFLMRDDFVTAVQQELDRHGVPGHYLVLEVTEQSILSDVKGAAAKLAALRRRGIKVALDDFGTGYSGLSYLRELPADIVKLDRSFVQHEVDKGQVGGLLEAIVNLGHALALKVTAEGIEDRSELERLRALGCDTGQGWLWSKALPPEQFVDWVARRRSAPGDEEPARRADAVLAPSSSR